MAPKKTLYELLELQPDASADDVRAAYARLTEDLQTRQAVLGHEEVTNRARLLRVAYGTLNNPDSRAAYDAELMVRRPGAIPIKPPAVAPAPVPAPAPVAGAGGTALSLTPQGGDPQAQELRTDALLLRAEAIALRANALELKAQALDRGKAVSVYGGGAAPPMLPVAPAHQDWAQPEGWMSWVNSSMRRVLLALGTFVAVGMVLQLVYVYSGARSGVVSAEAKRQAEEKTYLDDYQQTYGIRPANMAEARQMDENRRRETEAKRQQVEAERQRQLEEAKTQRFQEESQRRAEQVTARMQYDEERARMERQREESLRLYEQRQREEAERRRIEQQQAEWRRTLER